ncbi:MAG TPA: hypothetical protein VGH71_08665, partial [Gammaproteobacteria bacterium]
MQNPRRRKLIIVTVIALIVLTLAGLVVWRVLSAKHGTGGGRGGRFGGAGGLGSPMPVGVATVSKADVP